MTVKDLVRPIPGVRAISLLRQRLDFSGSAVFWERRYARGGTSGPGSYGELAVGKAEFLNTFVHQHGVRSVIEFGCGDGHQLSISAYRNYVGLDVSGSAIRRCKNRFAADATKSFFLYDCTCFVDAARIFVADLAISLDVIYHLIEDSVYEAYMAHLFDAGQSYVIVYSTNSEVRDDAPHVRHRCFTEWVDSNRPEWKLVNVLEGPASGYRRADFFVFERSGRES